MKSILSIALLVSATFACDTGSEIRRGSLAATSRPHEWVLAVRAVTEIPFEGRSTGDGAFELVLPERGPFSASTVLRLREYPRRVGGCTILSSSGYEETPLLLEGIREGDRIQLRESTEARLVEVTMNCDELVLTTPTRVEASAHEFEMELRDGETHEYAPPAAQPGPRRVVRYTLKSRAFVEARIQARRRTELPIVVRTPTVEELETLQAAIRAKDQQAAIELAAMALGLERHGRPLTFEYDPSIVDPDAFGRCVEGSGGGFTITLGPAALGDAPILLSTLLHEAVGHAALGLSEHDPEYANHWEVEELRALHIEATSAATLGLSQQQLARIAETLARRRTALKARDPGLEEEIGRELGTTEYIRWR